MSFVKRVNVDSFLTTLAADTPAVSQPIRVLCDDSNSYLLKTEYVYNEGTKSYDHYNCSFVNEYLSFCIAKHIGVPVPEAAIALIEKDFLDDEPMLHFNNRFKVGDHFSSVFLEQTENNIMKDYQSLMNEGKSHLKKPWNKFLGNLKNPEDVPKIIMFDFLIANLDRFNHLDNLLIENDQGRRIFAIDHGHAFGGPVWSSNKFSYLNNQNNPQLDYAHWYCNQHIAYTHRRLDKGVIELNGLGNVFRALDGYIDISDVNSHSFIDPYKLISSIDEELITQWLSEVPDTWYVDKTIQIEFYRSFLLNQIKFLPSIIQHLAFTDAFQSYTGGILKWSA